MKTYRQIFLFVLVLFVRVGHGAAEAPSLWSKRAFSNPQTHKLVCVVESRSKEIFDGYGQAVVFIRLTEHYLIVMTDSDLDSSFRDLALRVDNNEKILADDIVAQRNMVFRRSIAEILRQVNAGKRIELQLRFWPTWPSKGQVVVDFDLSGFTNTFKSPGC